MERDGRLHAIECKLTERPSSGDTASIRRLRSFYGGDMVASASVACTTQQAFDVAADVTARPGWQTWELAGS